MGKLYKLFPIVLVCLLLTQCGERCTSPCVDAPRALTQAEQQIVGAYNASGFKLLKEIIKEAPADTNVFVSPLSVSLALGMTLNGARGTSEEAMKSTLEFPDMEMQKINECYQALMELLPGLDPEVKFEIANSIWYRLGEPIREEFLNTCGTYFDAEVNELDFSLPEAASIINGWVEEKTYGKIKEIVEDPIRGVVVMFLINAIYFKGTWTFEFDPDLTEDVSFRLPDGSVAACRMMARPDPEELSEFEYFENDDIQAIDLPYADGWYSMTVILPKEGVDLNALIAGIDQETWDGWMSSFETREGQLQMPKFETEYDIELKDALTALGMGIAFNPGEADFVLSDALERLLRHVRGLAEESGS